MNKNSLNTMPIRKNQFEKNMINYRQNRLDKSLFPAQYESITLVTQHTNNHTQK